MLAIYPELCVWNEGLAFGSPFLHALPETSVQLRCSFWRGVFHELKYTYLLGSSRRLVLRVKDYEFAKLKSPTVANAQLCPRHLWPCCLFEYFIHMCTSFVLGTSCRGVLGPQVVCGNASRIPSKFRLQVCLRRSLFL